MGDFASDTFSGLIGVVVGAAIAYALGQRSQKLTLTFDFHREYNTVEMGRHRYAAEALLKQHPGLQFEQLGLKDTARMDSVFAVLRFFQRLSLAVKYNQVHGGIVREMFADAFYYWNYASFETGFEKSKVNGKEHIVYLARWFYRTVGRERHDQMKEESEKLLADWMRSATSL